MQVLEQVKIRKANKSNYIFERKKLVGSSVFVFNQQQNREREKNKDKSSFFSSIN